VALGVTKHSSRQFRDATEVLKRIEFKVDNATAKSTPGGCATNTKTNANAKAI